MFSNRYIFTYAGVLVIVVAIILSSANIFLKPYQKANERIEKMSGILASANIHVEKNKVPDTYNQLIKEEWVVNTKGDIISKFKDNQLIEGDFRAFDIKLKDELYKLSQGDKNAHFPIYVFVNNADTNFIIPLMGKGLWGPIWGNIALKHDFKTVKGATFNHKGETPGLGAEITTDWFQNQFKDKAIFDNNYKFTSIAVVKGGVGNSNINPQHGVDAISGGTITSKGVSSMLEDVLSIYIPFVKKHVTH